MMRATSALLLGAAIVTAAGAAPRAANPASDERTALYVLNRVTFGPRPGDVARVRQAGVNKFIDEQLHPERIADSNLARRLAPFETTRLSSRDIAERYEIPALQARRVRQQQGSGSTPQPPSPQGGAGDPQRQRANLPLIELTQQKIIRAVYGERQLEEVLTDFWFNHFNVDARKGPARFMLTEYERDAIRPHVFGHFRELLEATAKSPAMLFYLDNWMSAGPDNAPLEARQAGGRGRRPQQQARTPQQQARMRPTGLNENYARELLELHTLGVDGGYTQKDVTEVARALTGWTIEGPRRGGGFRFAPALHDQGEKTVLGHRVTSGGQRDGEEVLDIVSSHPSTARFISTKLATRFISDHPPDGVVQRMASTFQGTRGDLRAVMTVLLTSPEFLSPDSDSTKVKNPFEFVVSALRATNVEISDARPLARALQQLGMPLYQCQPPTGYKDNAETWVNTGALVNRMNVAVEIAGGKMPGVTLENPPVPEALLPNLSDATRTTIAKAPDAHLALALALGSPEFQRR